MPSPVYNSAILKMTLASRASSAARRFLIVFCVFFLCLFSGLAPGSGAANWSEPQRQLARKIVAVTGPGAVALTINNRSSLGKRESDIIGDGLRSALESLGIRLVPAEQAAASVAITLSENQNSYVWVAEAHQGVGENTVVMVSTPRLPSFSKPRDAVPLVLRKTTLWTQSDRILDLVVLEESSIPTRIAVLDGERVALYRWQAAKWDQEQSLAIAHDHPWPRDLRGRLVPGKDHLFDAYLPGVVCHTISSVPLALNCRESDDPWPLTFPAANGTTSSAPSPFSAFFAPTRNFFTGVLSPRIGKFSTVPKFYSVAFIPRDQYVLWLFAALDGQVHMIDGVSDRTLRRGLDRTGWGSDLATVRTSCGSGWQVLAVSPSDNDNNDSVRAYEIPDREPVAVSAPLEVSGKVTALWTEAKGDGAIAIVRHLGTGEYEAFQLTVSCSQ